jgi:hypothetical protein
MVACLAVLVGLSLGVAAPTSVELTFTGGAGQKLVGTFEAPEGKGPFPGVLLIPGSGPTDRDGNSAVMPGAKIDVLKQLADSLAAQGVSSFRFDKRAIAHYSADWPKTIPEISAYFSYRHHIEDAEAAFACLRSQPRVDHLRTAILGHSEGGLFTLQIASELADPPKAIVLVGTAGRTIGVVLREQISASLAAQPGVDAKPILDYIDAASAALAAGKPIPPTQIPGLGNLFTPAYYDLLKAYTTVDPTMLAVKYDGPVLIVNGEDDSQISPLRDAPKLNDAFKSRSKGTVELKVIPKASHNLKSTADGNKNAFVGPIVPDAMNAIVPWLVKQLG